MWLVVSLLGLTAALFSLLDVWYFLRAFFSVLRARLQPVVKDLLKEHAFSGLVLPHDLDFLLHMNNSRYLREADFARLSCFTRCGLFGAIHGLGAGMVMAACTVRYRRSLRLFEAFEIRTRLICWDDKAFYVEQRFVAPKDGFVCAVLLSRQHIIGNTPDKVVQSMCKRKVESPEFPDEVLHWIDYNDSSSQKLRAESGMSHTKDQ
ncbi:protein THEM6 [Rana temporaria]|uniref:protein THEM6 n=1 Tax=Rana temporaria TaxID=8407 RepID=UPI001AAC5EFA|nr:protein THEM6 [Rana temporaria]